MTLNDPIARDAALMKEVAAGNQKACRNLAAEHLDGTYRLALRITGNRSTAEDVAQEAFLRLWKASSRWEAKAQVKTWLYRVTHNLCIDRLRKENRYSDAEVPDLADPADNPVTQHEKQQLRAQVQEAVAALPTRQRIALSLVHFEDCSNKDAAKVMEISVDALESLLARGKRKLRDMLAPVGSQERKKAG